MSVLTSAAAASAQPGAQSEAVAVVVRVSGDVRVQPGSGPASRAAPGMRLRTGDRLNVPPGGQAVLLYRTGRSQRVTQSTRVQPPRGPGGTGVFQQTIRTLNEVSATDARTLPNRQGMIRPIAGSPVPVSPRNQIAVGTTRPVFLWTRVPDAAGYLIQIRDLAGGAPIRYPVGADTLFALPAGGPELARGRTYEWSVARRDGGRAAPPQRFRVLGQAELEAVDAELDGLRRIGLDPQADGAFLAAVVYRQAGLLYDALAALERVAVAGGGRGGEYHRLRGEIYAQLGMLDRAVAEFTAADTETF